MCLELSTLNKRFSTVWVVTQVGPLTRVSPFVSLERLLPRKHPVTDVATDPAGRVLSLADQIPHGICSGAASADSI